MARCRFSLRTWYTSVPGRGRTGGLGMTAQSKARAVGINHVALEVGDIDAALD